MEKSEKNCWVKMDLPTLGKRKRILSSPPLVNPVNPEEERTTSVGDTEPDSRIPGRDIYILPK